MSDYEELVMGHADDNGDLSEPLLSHILRDHSHQRHEYSGSHNARKVLDWLGY